MTEETFKNNGAAALSDEELEQVDGGLFGVLTYIKEQERKEREQQEREIIKGRPTAALKQ